MLPQYPITTMLSLVAVLCVSLGLTQINYLIGGAVMVAYVLGVVIVGRDSFCKRALVYGTVGGACLFVIVAIIVATARGELPRVSYTTLDTTISFTRQYAIPIGGFIGGLGGCIYAGGRSTRKETVGDS